MGLFGNKEDQSQMIPMGQNPNRIWEIEEQQRKAKEQEKKEEQEQTRILIHISVSKKKQLKELSKKSGLSLSAYIRNRLFIDPIKK